MQTRFLTLATAIVSVASCTGPTEPLENVSAVVVQQTIARENEGASERVTATFRIAITNRSALDVYYSGCGVALEQKTNSRWEYATSPVCLLMLPANPTDGMIMIPAGLSREVEALMYADIDGQGWPSGGLDGLYRLRMTLLSPAPVAWRGMQAMQYRSHSLFTNQFAVEPN